MQHRTSGGGLKVPALDRGLRTVRRRAKVMLIAQRCGLVLACALGAILALALADYVLRTPSWFRGGLWVMGLSLLGWAGWKYLLPVFRFSPSLTEVALRIEKTEAGRSAGLQHLLASGLELSDEEHGENRTAGPVVEEAGRRFVRLPTASLFSRGQTGRSLGALGLVAALAAAIVVGSADYAWIGARRVLTPWAGAQWPKRTQVADATGVKVHPIGTALALRAAVLRLHGDPLSAESARVIGRYRLIQDGVEGPIRRVLFDKPLEVPERERVQGQSAVLFERLIQPIGPAPSPSPDESGRAALRTAELEYWFETDDDKTEPARVLLVEPPAVLSAQAEITPPSYAAGGASAINRSIDLGTGMDERASAGPVLAGSRVKVTLRLNKAVPTEGGHASAQWVGSTLGDDLKKVAEEQGAGRGLDARFDGAVWTIEWTLRERARVAVHLTDEHGIKGVEESGYTFEALEDRAPSATVTKPQEDKTVLPTATVEVAGEGLDDVGLTSVALERRQARAPKGSQGAPAEAIGEWVEMGRTTAAAAETPGSPGGPARSLSVSTTVDLGALGVHAGDEVWLSAVAADAYELDGKKHDPARSPVRRLRIISVEEMTEQMWAELAGIRRSAIGLEEEQGRLERDVQRSGEATRLERSQAGITDRVARDRQSMEHLQERAAENGLKDETLSSVMREAGRLLDQAGKKSVDAGQDLKDAGKAEQEAPADSKAGKKDRESAVKSQEDVRENLANLAELLDQGEDTWAMRRSLERVLSEQKSLRDQTADAAQRTLGKSEAQLTPQEKQELNRIASEQKSVAEKAAEAIQKMLEAQPKLQKKDPAGADALAEAARRGQQDQVRQKMDQASKQVEQNQTSSAKGTQDRAIESLEQMLESLKNASRNRDEVLRRKLASLIESLEALIKEQEKQLGLLAPAREKGDFAGLDAGMARLHQNTLGVMDEASQGPREMQPVAEAIGEAAAAQSASVVDLRGAPVNADEAEAQETISLEKLKEAKETAERLDREAQARQTARKRAELKRAYTEALEEQVAIRTETEPLVDAEATRRMKATARSLGERQTALQDKMAKLDTETKELTVVFSYAHRRLDEVMAGAALGLNRGEVTKSVTWKQDQAVRVLQSILKALEDAQPQDKEFRDQQSGGQGQQGNGQPPPLIPPVAELRLLKLMQEEAMDRTQEADVETADGHADPEHVEAVGKLQKDLAEQADALIKKQMRNNRRPDPTTPEPGKDGGESRPPAGGGGGGQ